MFLISVSRALNMFPDPPDFRVVGPPWLEMEDYSLISPRTGLARAKRSRTLISMSL